MRHGLRKSVENMPHARCENISGQPQGLMMLSKASTTLQTGGGGSKTYMGAEMPAGTAPP
jgi:hypothetical protein